MTEGTPPVDQPIQVDTSVTAASLVTAFRQLMLIIAGFGTIVAFVQAHNLVGLVNWIKGNDFVTFVTTAITLAVFIYGQWRARKTTRDNVALTKSVSDAVAVLAPSWITRLLNAVRSAISPSKQENV